MQGRLAPLRRKLLPTLSSGGASPTIRRQPHIAYRLSLRGPPLTGQVEMFFAVAILSTGRAIRKLSNARAKATKLDTMLTSIWNQRGNG
jgi:hypothetical protein